MTEIDWHNEFDGILSSYSMLCLPPDDFEIVSGKIVRALKNEGWFLLMLNEGNSSEGGIETVQGQKIYTTGLSEGEIRKYFEPKGMKVVGIERESGETKEYGVEHEMIFLMQKVS